MGGLQFERAVYRVHEGVLYGFAADAVPALARVPGRGALQCSPNRACFCLQAGVGLATLALFAVTVALHAGHVGAPGCAGQVLARAAAQWAAQANASACAAPGALANCSGGFAFRPDDLFELQLDWTGKAVGPLGAAGFPGSPGDYPAPGAGGGGSGGGRLPGAGVFTPEDIFGASANLVVLDYTAAAGSAVLPLAAGLPGSAGAATSVGVSETSFSMAEDKRRFRVFNVTLPLGACIGDTSGSFMDFLLGYLVSYDVRALSHASERERERESCRAQTLVVLAQQRGRALTRSHRP